MFNTNPSSADHTHLSVTLLAVGLLIFTLFQLSQIILDRVQLGKLNAQLAASTANVDKALEENAQMMDRLNTVAVGTQKLAQAGNANAREIVSQLERAGIRINPDFRRPAPGAPPGAMPPGAPAGMPRSAPAAPPVAAPPAPPAPPPPPAPAR